MRGLRDVFRDDEFRAKAVVEAGVLERGLSSATIGGVFRIGDGDGIDCWSAKSVEGEGSETGVVAGPEDERAASVRDRLRFFGAAGIDHALREREVGGKEEIEGRAVDDLRGERRRGLIRGFGADAGLLLELGEKRGEQRLQVRSGSDAEGLLGAGERCDLEKEEREEDETRLSGSRCARCPP